MRLSDSLNFSFGRLSAASLACLLLLSMGHVAAQTAAPAQPQAASQPALAMGQTWLSLSKSEKASLAPLEKSWNVLSEGQKRKWQAIANTYPNLGAVEQEKLHSRMAEWAALSPKGREAARLNFAQTKTATKSDRSANWEAYQALSPEEREKLAQESKVKPVGAAVSLKPVAPEKLTPVPVTRHTPEAERSAAVSQSPINRTTLLPQMPVRAASAPPTPILATPSKP